MTEIIDNLLLCLELEGDGGYSSFTIKEKDDMYNFLISLKNQNIELKNTVWNNELNA